MSLTTSVFTTALAIYLASFVLSMAGFWTRSKQLNQVAGGLIAAGILACTFWLAALWRQLGHPPATTPAGFFGLYVVVASFSTLIACRYWSIENTYFAFLVLPLAVMAGIQTSHATQPVIPKMDPVLLGLHVITVLISMALLTLAFSGGWMLFTQDRLIKSKSFGFLMQNLPPLSVLDELTYQNLTFGFVFLSLTTLLGFSGAQRAWGSYVPANLKVFFGVTVWLFYAVYLFTRARHGWRGRRLALFALLGFFVIILAGVSSYIPSGGPSVPARP